MCELFAELLADVACLYNFASESLSDIWRSISFYCIVLYVSKKPKLLLHLQITPTNLTNINNFSRTKHKHYDFHSVALTSS